MTAGNQTRQVILDRIDALLDTSQGVLLVGDLGIGKSHLAREVAGRRTRDYVEVLIGSPAIRGISFGAAAHLIPDRTVADPLRLLQLARRALEERAAGHNLVLIVDDIDQLDAGTLALVHQLAVGGNAAVLATVRESQASIPQVAALWEDEHLVRFDLRQLTRREHDDMVADLAGTTVPYTLSERIWDLTQGNPLFAREIVLALAGDGLFDPAMAISEALLESTRLRHYLGHRLDGLSEAERAIVASIALTEPLDAGVVHHLFAAATIETVHQRQLVLTEHTEDRLVYRTSHPLLAELVRAGLTPRTRDALLAEVANASLDQADNDPATDLRIASWLLEAGLPVDADLALRAAQVAQRVFDGDSAVRLSAAALADGPSFERFMAHGMALSLVGQVEEADRNLAQAEVLTSDEATVGDTTVMRALNLMHRGGETERAVGLLRQRADEFSDSSARANIESMIMQGEGLQGDFRRALDLGPQLAAAARNGDIAELRVLVSLTVARMVTGRLETANEELDRGLAVAGVLADQHPVEADQIMLNQMLYEMTRPDLDAAIRLVVERLASQSGAGEGPWFYLAGWALSTTGDLVRAEQAALASLQSLATVDPIGLRLLAAGVHAMILAQSGQLKAAADEITEALRDPRSTQPRSQMFLSRAQAWLTAHQENPEAAAKIAVSRGNLLVGQWHQTWGAWTAFDAVRLGHAELALEQLERIAAHSDDGAVQLFADHAGACADRDEPALTAIAERWEQTGALAHAAEAHAHAAAVSSTVDRAAWHSQRAINLQHSCPGLSSPVLNRLKSPLTNRENDIARRAATGRSSRKIAEDLYISSRTVDNHLRSVYASLGLGGRNELAELFAVTHSPADAYSITP